MNVAYLIGPLEASDLLVDSETLAEMLETFWPGVEIERYPADAPYPLEWVVNIGDFPVMTGKLQRGQQTIVIETSLPHLARFAAWYRSFVPVEYALFIYDGAGAIAPLQLRPGATEQEIAGGI